MSKARPRRYRPNIGEVLIMNRDWKIVMRGTGMVGISGPGLPHEIVISLPMLYSLGACIEEVKRIVEAGS